MSSQQEVSSSLLSSPSSGDLPLREIPGDYGLPFFRPIKDRWDFFYLQGKMPFFKSRIQKYNSTIFRVNMPPGPCISPDPRVIALLDAYSIPLVFDMSKVEKRDVLTGTYVPKSSFYGNTRVCANLDPSEPNHAALKGLLLSFLASKHEEIIPLFQTGLKDLFSKLEDQMNSTKRGAYSKLNDEFSFDYVFKLFCDGKDPKDIKLETSEGASIFKKWFISLVSPVTSFSLPKLLSPIEDLIVHCIGIPFLVVKSGHDKIYDALYNHANSFLDKAESLGFSRDEACHQLFFFAGGNAFAGFQAFFSTLMKYVGSAGESLHQKLAQEVRSIVKSEGGVTVNAINQMALVKSVINEAFRLEPPVPYMYARVKEDVTVESHDGKFNIKKGEMIFGYITIAMRDPKVFLDPDEFVGDRFIGEGEKLLKYVYWSNGRSTEEPRLDNKQCAGKNLAELLSRMLLVEFFLRYDTFSVETAKFNTVTFTSLKKASDY